MEASTASSREGLEDQIRGCAEPMPSCRGHRGTCGFLNKYILGRLVVSFIGGKSKRRHQGQSWDQRSSLHKELTYWTDL